MARNYVRNDPRPKPVNAPTQFARDDPRSKPAPGEHRCHNCLHFGVVSKLAVGHRCRAMDDCPKCGAARAAVVEEMDLGCRALVLIERCKRCAERPRLTVIGDT